jgi:hypothetical protein
MPTYILYQSFHLISVYENNSDAQTHVETLPLFWNDFTMENNNFFRLNFVCIKKEKALILHLGTKAKKPFA